MSGKYRTIVADPPWHVNTGPSWGRNDKTAPLNARPRVARHSAKPDAFIDLVEQVSPGPYLELFARRARFGWDYYGDESLGTAEMPEVAA